MLNYLNKLININKITNIFDKELKSWKSFFESNKFLTIIAIIFAVLSFGYAITLFTLGVSTETSVFNESSGSSRWAAQSRFSIAVLKKIFATNEILPFRTSLLAVIMIVLTALVLCKIISEVNNFKVKKYSNVIFAILFISMPISAHYMYYLTYNFEIGIGMFLCALAVYFFNKNILILKKENKSIIFSFLGIICLVTAIGEYQSFIPFFMLVQATTILLYFYNNDVKIGEKIKIISKYIILLILSIILYYIISKIFLIFIPVEKYSEGFISWGKKDVSVIINDLKSYFLGIYLKRSIYGSLIILPTVIMGCILSIYFLIFKKKIIESILVIFLLLTPMILPVLLGTAMPYRTQQTIMLMVPIIWYLVYNNLNNKFLSKLFIILAFLFAIRQTMYINQIFYSDYLRYQNDINLSRRISDKIYDLNIENIENYPVVYLGKKETTEIPNLIKQELIGYSIYEWDNGNYKRMQHFMTLTTAKFKLVEDESILENAKQVALEMPSWPNKGSVDFRSNMIIVKLSEY